MDMYTNKCIKRCYDKCMSWKEWDTIGGRVHFNRVQGKCCFESWAMSTRCPGRGGRGKGPLRQRRNASEDTAAWGWPDELRVIKAWMHSVRRGTTSEGMTEGRIWRLRSSEFNLWAVSCPQEWYVQNCLLEKSLWRLAQKIGWEGQNRRREDH